MPFLQTRKNGGETWKLEEETGQEEQWEACIQEDMDIHTLKWVLESGICMITKKVIERGSQRGTFK